jgi:hypothetical protein
MLPEEVVSRSRIPDILRVFPNLRKLDLSVSYDEIEVLQFVFGLCTELTHLTIRRSSNGWKKSRFIVDHIFTGVPNDICAKIAKSLGTTSRRFPFVRDSTKALRIRPGITQLTKLRHLEMKDLQYMVEVTDVTGTLAFLEMESLEYLNSGRSLMSTSCLKKLAGRFPHNMAYQASLPRISSSSKEVSEEENYLCDIRDMKMCTVL